MENGGAYIACGFEQLFIRLKRGAWHELFGRVRFQRVAFQHDAARDPY